MVYGVGLWSYEFLLTNNALLAIYSIRIRSNQRRETRNGASKGLSYSVVCWMFPGLS